MATPFSATAMPRRLVTGVTGTRRGAVLIQLAGHPPVAVAAGTSGVRRGARDYRAAGLKAAGRILSALDAVPPAPSAAAGVTRRRRPLAIAASALCAAQFATVAVLVLSGAVGG